MAAAVFLISYEGAVRSGKILPSKGRSLRDINRIKCESYLLGVAHPSEVLLLGSSYTASLPVEDISPCFVNLGLAGDSLWTGLEIVRASTRKPRQVVLEVAETLTRGVGSDFLEPILSPLGGAIRRHVHAFRAEYEPIGIGVELIGNWQTRRFERSTGTKIPPIGVGSLTAGLVEKRRVAEQVLLNETEVVELRAAAGRLQACIDEFEKAGIPCHLQRIPGNATLIATPRRLQINAILESELPASRYHWVAALSQFQSETWDDGHLTAADARRYAEYLVKEIGGESSAAARESTTASPRP